MIVVSHDRAFLDNVVTSTIVFEENGRIEEYVGGYSDWLRQGHTLTETDDPITDGGNSRQESQRSSAKKATKLSYKNQRELDGLPDRITALEQRIAELQSQMSAPDFYSQDHTVVQIAIAELSRTEAQLESALERWSELESLQDSLRAPD